MPVKEFAKIDDIPEAERTNAVELKDGTFRLFVEDDATPLKEALAEERRLRDAAEKNATKAAKALAAAESQAKARAAGFSEEQIAAMRNDVKKEIDAEYEPIKARAAERDALEAKVRALQLDDRVKAMMATKEAGVRAERIETLFALKRDKFDLTTDGKPMLKDQPGVSVDTYIRETLKAEFPEFFVATRAAGSGAPGSSGAAGSASLVPEHITDPAERIAWVREHGKTR